MAGPTYSDLLLIGRGTALYKATVSEIANLITLNPMQYGATGAGVGDDTTALNSAMAAAAAVGGVVRITHRHLLSSNIVVPRGVKLMGGGLPAGEAADWHTTHNGTLLLPRANNIKLMSGAMLNGLLIYPAGLTTSTTSTQAAAWTGTAVILADYCADQVVEDCAIFGYETAISKEGGLTGSVNGINRPRIVRNNIDCRNGIVLAYAQDVPYVRENHAWPFMSTTATVETNNMQRVRDGTFMALGEICDWAQILNNFCYGYMVGYDIVGGDQVNVIDNGCDHVPELVNYGNIAYRTRGSANQTTFSRNRAASATHTFYVDTASAQGTTVIEGNRVWACDQNGVVVNDGSVIIRNNTFGDSINPVLPNGVNIFAGAERVEIYNNRFENVTNAINPANATLTVLHRDNEFVTVTTPVVTPHIVKQTAVDGLVIDPTATTVHLVNVSGGTVNIGTLVGGAAFNQKTVTIVGATGNTGAVVMYAGASMALTSDMVLEPEDVIVLAGNGSNWVEVSRSKLFGQYHAGYVPAPGTASGKMLYDTGWGNAPSGTAPVRTVSILTAAHTNTSATTSSTITDGTTAWTHSFVAGKSYRITVLGTYQTSLATAGIRLSLLGSGGVAGQLGGIAWGAISQGSVATSLDATLFALGTVATAWPTGSFLLTTAVNPINSPHQLGVNAVFRCTTSGTIAFQQAPEVAATSQINIGSVLIIEELN